MLATLGTGIEGGKWFRLIDKSGVPRIWRDHCKRLWQKAEAPESTIRVRE
jgi:hypothetical protein